MISALVLGLFGSLHCLGMCGPIALSLPLDRSSVWTASTGAALYNTGRILGYATMGLLLGKVGQTIAIVEISKWVSLLTGLFIIGYIIYRYTPWIHGKSFVFPGISRFQGFVARQFGRSSYEGSFLIGLLNAFLPCGFVYIALVAAVNTASPLEGAAYMALFGLGTAPMMLSVNLVGAKFRNRFALRRYLPYFLGLFAVLFILRGLALDIPFLSPLIQEGSFLHACLP